VRASDAVDDGAWDTVYDSSAAFAAQKYVEVSERRSVEWPVASGGETVVVVRPRGGGAEVSYRVTGESVPTYYASIIKPDPPKKELQRDLVGRRVRLTRILGTAAGDLWQVGDELLVTWTNAGLFVLRSPGQDSSGKHRIVTDVKRSDFELCDASEP
jgi:hypothetical protein